MPKPAGVPIQLPNLSRTNMDFHGSPLPLASVSPALPVVSPPAIVQSLPVGPSILPQGKFCLDLCVGSPCPLAQSLREAKVAFLSIDVFLSDQHDLLENSAFECILRIAASGQVAYTAAAPNCSEFLPSPLHQPGQSSVRTLDHPFGIPNPTPQEQHRIDSSREFLHRCLHCLQATVAAGGHGHLEQPKEALSWQDPRTNQWLMLHGRFLVAVPACS